MVWTQVCKWEGAKSCRDLFAVISLIWLVGFCWGKALNTGNLSQPWHLTLDLWCRFAYNCVCLLNCMTQNIHFSIREPTVGHNEIKLRAEIFPSGWEYYGGDSSIRLKCATGSAIETLQSLVTTTQTCFFICKTSILLFASLNTQGS